MTLQASGIISMNDLDNEYQRGSGAPLSLGQMYRNGGIVQSNALSIPTSGPISMSMFYGVSRRYPVTLHISANTSNYLVNTAIIAGYQAGATDLLLFIDAGVEITSSSTSAYSMTIDASWNTNDVINIVNYGYIVGHGGDGGTNFGGFNSPGGPGTGGGPALSISRPILMTNWATIGGGGGGGGAAGSPSPAASYFLQSGGGGGGAGYGAGGACGAYSYGVNGTVSAGGAGGVGYNGMTGGSGGGLGSNGGAGQVGDLGTGAPGGGGGGAGVAVNGNAYINWLNTGTLLGPIL